MQKTVHNPDQYMGDLRQILAQGRKRLALLLGAGGPGGILVDASSGRLASTGKPLIPMISALTEHVRGEVRTDYGNVLDAMDAEFTVRPNVEEILSRVRTLADVLGPVKVHDLDGAGYKALGQAICDAIGDAVNVSLPKEPNPYSELSGWIGGTARDHPVEIFTSNYDLLLEQAFERSRVPYYDGFCGSCEAFFDPATVASSDLPARWARIWKLHGSLGWKRNAAGDIIRTSDPKMSELIYPTHLKYDQTQKFPYIALFERLRNVLQQADSLLITSGFSFSDTHVVSVLDEALASNSASAVIAFQFGRLEEERKACSIALRRANMSVYARDGAVIDCVEAPWHPGELAHPALAPIRGSYWGQRPGDTEDSFLLGAFSAFARYVALTRASQVLEPVVPS